MPMQNSLPRFLLKAFLATGLLAGSLFHSLSAQEPDWAIRSGPLPSAPAPSFRMDGFKTLDDPTLAAQGGWQAGNGFVDSPIDPGVQASIGDPLLEKQLKYTPPSDDIEGMILEASDPTLAELDAFASERYTNYRSQESSLSFLPGGATDFGWLSLESQPYLAKGYRTGLTSAIDIHWLTGPTNVHLPARLYDFILGYQARLPLGKRLSIDMAASIGAFSDFEGTARNGVRYPAHAVGMYRWNRATDLVLGVDYLGRDDYKILPVFGLSFRHPRLTAWRFDMVYPRPRIDYMISPARRLYVAGLLGGGTWDIELPNDVDEVMTYRDFRLMFGYERISPKGDRTGIELGYVFDRELEFRNRPDQFAYDDAFVLRIVKRN